MNKHDKPNIFTFGTSELTQDAFIAWLISWADPKFEKVDVALHNTGEDLLSKIFELNGKKMPNIESLEIHAQKNKMDVYVKINNEYHIIIEDKILSKTYPKQLEKYINNLTNGQKIDPNKIVPIFFKTMDQSRYYFDNNDYKIIERKVILDVLKNGINEGVHSDLYKQYYNYLMIIENNVEAFKTMNPKNWNHSQWRGFFKFVYEEIMDGDWGYVSNKKGGFIGYWWNGYEVVKNHVYLQIEKDKLCFKIRSIKVSTVSKDDKWEWLERVNSAGLKKSVSIIKPKKMGHGKHVTFAVLDLGGEEHWIPMKDDKPDLKKAVEKLKIAENILNEAVNCFYKGN